MDNKKEVRITLSTIIIIIVVFVLLVIACCLAISNSIKKNYEVANQKDQINEMQNQIKDLNNSINTLIDDNKVKNVEKPVVTDKNATNEITDNEVLYGIISVGVDSADEITYEYKFLDDKKELDNFVKEISNAEMYHQNTFIADFGDTPPLLTLFFTDERPLHLMAVDGYNDDGDIVNLICIYYDSESGSDKTLYKVDTEFANYIEKTYRNTRSNKISEGKEIYGLINKSNLSNEEDELYNFPYLVLEGNLIYLSNNLSDRIYEGTYKLRNGNTLEIALNKETEDYAFLTASIFKKDSRDGIDYIRIENGESYIEYEIIK